jgi:signal transduction histidine kinase
VVQQSSALTSSILQREMAGERAKELEKLNQVKSQFIAHVTHELRSPVNAIIGLAELLRMAADKGSIEQIRERLSFMISSATSLRAIITNILDLSKMEAGKMEVASQSVDVSALIAEIAEMTRVLIGSKSVVVEVTAPPLPVMITTDPIKLRQIIMNLTSNAAKFTESGRIAISLGVVGSSLEITIRDTGIGIKEEHLHKLFTAFSQIEDAQTKKHQGTGLGLTISKNLSELIGGAISVQSVFGEGTTFTITLPHTLMERQGGLYNAE